MKETTSIESSTNRALVVGASGFLGSHIVKALCLRGRKVRILIRPTSNITALQGLDFETCYGDVLDPASLDAAMNGCTTVYHSAVDTRAWLDDPTPLFRCNVDGLVNSMEAALANQIQRFVFTSSIATIGLNPIRKPSEADAFNWRDIAPAYILSRVAAEDALFDYCKKRGLPGIALCVANTYGPADIQPTPHGELLWNAATGKMPIAINCGAPWVDVRDAAVAMILAEERGQLGERYIVAAGYVSQPEFYTRASSLLGKKAPVTLPLGVAQAIAWITEKVAKLLGKRDVKLTTQTFLLSHIFRDLDNSKARSHLRWGTRPLDETIQDTVNWFAENRPRKA